MPKRHGKSKYSLPNKKRKEINQPTSATQQPLATQVVPQPASHPTPAPIAKSAATTRNIVVQHPYIGTELRQIGILAGVMLVALIILALILPKVLP